MDHTAISPEVEAAIEEVVRADLGRFGIERVEVVDSEDAGGDPAIQVLVHYSSASSDPDPRATSRLVITLNNRLRAMKERRFAFMSHKVPEPPRKARARG